MQTEATRDATGHVDRVRTARARTVLVVDDHRTVADLLRLALDTDRRTRCIGVAYDLPTARELASATLPDVVVCDIQFAGSDEDGVDFAAQVSARHPGTLVVLLTGASGPIDLVRVAASGVSALLAKDGDLAGLLTAISTTSGGQLQVDPRLLHALTRPVAPPAVELTARESLVLLRLAEGVNAQRIARDLGIRTSTCRGYIKSLLHKLGAHSQLEAVARARAMGLLVEDHAG